MKLMRCSPSVEPNKMAYEAYHSAELSKWVMRHAIHFLVYSKTLLHVQASPPSHYHPTEPRHAVPAPTLSHRLPAHSAAGIPQPSLSPSPIFCYLQRWHLSALLII
ncbi:unnamed protein product [Citrullus colocynthis]|uniref:Uncharacterized protein n=1 Tax=Citrullus colocynthis TaxID=252529 RepID=A0ABP0XNA1_9ROSI